MCGRFGLSYPRMSLKDWCGVMAMPEFEPRYNIAPTNNIVVIRDRPASWAGSMMRWGLIPFWAKDTKKQPLLHNARAETVAVKPLFRNSLHRRRCIIPASGFYEWQRLPDGRKQPFYVSAKDSNPLSFAGIWDSATTVDGEIIDSCAIITTDCNALMQPIHDRMSVIVPMEDLDAWLNPMPQPDEVLLPILKPFDPDQMQLWAVSPAVGNVANQGEGLIRPLTSQGL